MKHYPDLEAEILELRRFKKERHAAIQSAFFSGQQDLSETMAELTHTAEAILLKAWRLAKEELSHLYGPPGCRARDGSYLPSRFAVVGMGKFGGRELHFGSDLDLIFIYSCNGETQGPRSVTNKEYFAKLAQRIISYLTMTTPLGYAYKIDTELRPSGNAGTLVTPLDTWITYYRDQAAIWEQQALLKARLIFAEEEFEKSFDGLFQSLVYLKPFPKHFGQEIRRLRMRIESELAKESNIRWDYKKGCGGLIDIEFTVQYLQMKWGLTCQTLLTPNTLEALARLQQSRILESAELELLRQAYRFYRRLEIYLESIFDLAEGYLDLEHECLPDLARKMSFPGKAEFLGAFDHYRREVRRLFLKTLEIEGP